jgi:hypothetical protein
MSRAELIAKRQKLYDENPHCNTCGTLTWFPPRMVNTNFKTIGKKIYTMATIGHKYGKCNPKRYTEPSSEKTYRLLCYKCNQKENAEEMRELMNREQKVA